MSLEDKCWAAFDRKDHEEAVHLLPLVKEPDKITREILYSSDRINLPFVSLLALSSRNGWLDVTKDLITKYHCDPHERGKACLHYAAEYNRVDVMRYLIDECHCDPMAADRGEWTPLHWATYMGSSAAVEYLLSTGINVIQWLLTVWGGHLFTVHVLLIIIVQVVLQL